MLQQSQTNNRPAGDAISQNLSIVNVITDHSKADEINDFFQRHYLGNLAEFMRQLGQPAGKKNFLVYKNNKYINIVTDNIAYFYVKYDSTIIVTFDKQEYFINQSLEEIQNRLLGSQFFRLNRQHLVSFKAIKEVEHYFARKLLVNLVIPTKEKIIISKEKSVTFLNWLDNR